MFTALEHINFCHNICLLIRNWVIGEQLSFQKDILYLNICIRTKELSEPHIPMSICNKTFQLVDKHLGALGYDGPVRLSCDDTKLFASWWLYWDAKEKAHFMVGGVGDPMQVADPDHFKEIIDDANLTRLPKSVIILSQGCVTDKLTKYARYVCAVYKCRCQKLHQ